MASTHGDPRVLYSINNLRAYLIQDGEETDLTPSGPQTLSLLMVPTMSPEQQQETGSAPEEDFYLHLHLPPELDMPLPATTQIYHQPPNSYLIPRWDLGPDAGAFIRLQFPGIGSGSTKVSQEDVDTFETILAQCTAFLERAAPPSSHAPYNPADYAPGEGYISSPNQKDPDSKGFGQIVLVDEEDGSVVGELSEGYNVVEKPDVKPGSKSKSSSRRFMQVSLLILLQIPSRSNSHPLAKNTKSASATSPKNISAWPATQPTKTPPSYKLQLAHPVSS
jgi:spartin